MKEESSHKTQQTRPPENGGIAPPRPKGGYYVI